LEERDSRGTHLVIYPDGAFSCAANQGEPGADHRKIIKRLIGLNDPKAVAEAKRISYSIRKQREATAKAKADMRKAGNVLWEAVKRDYSMSLEEFSSTSPQSIPSDPSDHFRTFCGFFQPDDLIWCGEKYDCNAVFLRHLFPAKEWERQWEVIGIDRCEYSNGHSFNYRASSRAAKYYQDRRLLVIEHDHATVPEQIALIRFLVAQGMMLKGVLHTGGKGLHGLFSPLEKLQDMARIQTLLEGVGADLQSANRSQTRTPGALRDIGNRQLFVWIGGAK
jgi:hypothetical protein